MRFSAAEGVALLDGGVERAHTVARRGLADPVDLVHERQQPADLPRRETLAREPGEVVAGQVGDQPTLVLAEGHRQRHQLAQGLAVHAHPVASARVRKGRLRSRR